MITSGPSSAAAESVISTAPSPNAPAAYIEPCWLRELRKIQYTFALYVHRALGTNGERRLDLHYPMRFKLLTVVTLLMSCWWMLNFFIAVLPAAVDTLDGPCRLTDDQLRQNAIVLFGYFLCFAVVRVFIFLPGVAARVAEILLGQEGPWRLYALRMILHGPLYIFGIGSILFTFQLVLSPKCEAYAQDPELHSTFRTYAIYSCLVFASCLSLAFVHSAFISQAGRQQILDKRRAPPGTVEKLLTLTYDPELFGDEDEKTYPGECPICLQEWEVADLIKITPCRHAFHSDCIGHWLATERTCAFCRQDVTMSHPPRSTTGASSASRHSVPETSAPPPEILGSIETSQDQALPGALGSLADSTSSGAGPTDGHGAATNNSQEVAVEVREASTERTDEITAQPNATALPAGSVVASENVMDGSGLDPDAQVLDHELDMLEHALQELDRDRPSTV